MSDKKATTVIDISSEDEGELVPPTPEMPPFGMEYLNGDINMPPIGRDYWINNTWYVDLT